MTLDSRHARLVAGVMSGTSLDGIDVAIAHIAGRGNGLTVVPRAATSEAYRPDLRAMLLEAATSETFSVTLLSQLNVRLAHAYARCVRRTMTRAGVNTLDLIGSHGQTVRHVPKARSCAGLAVASTLQIGDPSVLANLLRVPVVGDFRMADMALGGQGAPLVPYYDLITFGHAERTRGLLNIGGIANLTVLPAGCGADGVSGFDTGCGNMVLDALAVQLLKQPMDHGGKAAAAGRPAGRVLRAFLRDAYFRAPPPKSTGRERYGPDYVRRFLAACSGLSTQDTLATATALTAQSVWRAYRDFVHGRHSLDTLIVSGGGRRNKTLMQMLRQCFAPIEVTTSDALGVDSDAKEALCFAVLAHETLNGHPTSLPGVTGASRTTILGKICLPA